MLAGRSIQANAFSAPIMLAQCSQSVTQCSQSVQSRLSSIQFSSFRACPPTCVNWGKVEAPSARRFAIKRLLLGLVQRRVQLAPLFGRSGRPIRANLVNWLPGYLATWLPGYLTTDDRQTDDRLILATITTDRTR